MATFSYIINKTVLDILKETAQYANTGGFKEEINEYSTWDFVSLNGDCETRINPNTVKCEHMRFGIYDRYWNCYPEGEIKNANNGRWELIFNTYGFVSQSTYRVIEISDTQSKVIFTGAWNALCASNLMPQGIDHPYHARITCEVSDITGVDCKMNLSQYLMHRFLNYSCLAQPKFPIPYFIFPYDQIKRKQVYRFADWNTVHNVDKFLSNNKQNLQSLEGMIASALQKWPKFVRYEERSEEQKQAWQAIDQLALAIAGETPSCDRYRSRAKTLVQAITAKIFKL